MQPGINFRLLCDDNTMIPPITRINTKLKVDNSKIMLEGLIGECKKRSYNAYSVPLKACTNLLTC